MPERTFIRLETVDGKQYLSTMSYEELFEKLQRIELTLRNIENRLFILEKPLRKKSILEILKRDGTRSYHFLKKNAWNFQPSDLRELVDKGKVVETRHGHITMYSLGSSVRRDTE